MGVGAVGARRSGARSCHGRHSTASRREHHLLVVRCGTVEDTKDAAPGFEIVESFLGIPSKTPMKWRDSVKWPLAPRRSSSQTLRRRDGRCVPSGPGRRPCPCRCVSHRTASGNPARRARSAARFPQPTPASTEHALGRPASLSTDAKHRRQPRHRQMRPEGRIRSRAPSPRMSPHHSYLRHRPRRAHRFGSRQMLPLGQGSEVGVGPVSAGVRSAGLPDAGSGAPVGQALSRTLGDRVRLVQRRSPDRPYQIVQATYALANTTIELSGTILRR
jgi:hypothetical protein